MKPRISIITPSFNQSQFLEQTIDSVLSQNYPNLQYIIIDGGSSDDSINIIKKYEKHLDYWVSEKDRGQSHAINKGFERATGDVINWLNSDDFYEPNALWRVSEIFDDPSVNLFCARSNIVENGKILQVSKGTDIYFDNLPKTIGWARIDQPETFVKREVYNVTGLINESFHYIMDREWWVRYLLHFGLDGICQTNDILVNFRFHNESKTKSQKQKFEIENHELFYEISRLYGLLPEIEFMQKEFGVGETPHALTNYNAQLPQYLINKAVHYYFLYLADHAYYTNDQKRTNNLLKFINPDILTKSEVKLFNKLKFRSKIVALPLIQWMRKNFR